MLTVLNIYMHGYVTLPVVLACKKEGLFSVLEHDRAISFENIVTTIGANPGSLAIALNMLESLGWNDRKGDDYQLTDESHKHKQIPGDIIDLLSFPMEVYVSKHQTRHSLMKWIALSSNRWGLDCETTAMMLDGMLIVPLVLSLKVNAGIDSQESVRATLDRLPAKAKAEVLAFFTIRTG